MFLSFEHFLFLPTLNVSMDNQLHTLCMLFTKIRVLFNGERARLADGTAFYLE